MKTNNEELGRFTAPGEVRFLRLLPGPIERVWAYLTDSEKRAKWLAAGPMDLRAGGRLELHFHHRKLDPQGTPPADYAQVQDPGVTFSGQILRCEPPRLLSFTWGGSEPDSEVTFELTPQGDHVQLLLVHRKLPDVDTAASVSAGWHTHVAILLAQLADREPPSLWAMHGRLEREYRAILERGAPTPAA